MGRIYYKELPLFHLYDSDLTCTQKLLMSCFWWLGTIFTT